MLDLLGCEGLFGVDKMLEAKLLGRFLEVADETVPGVEIGITALADCIGGIVLGGGEHLVFAPLVC